MSDLFIPKKIKVGFQNREDTYTKRLAYVIYFDNKGVLRKEKSWESWRDKKIEPEEYENNPQDGFVLNKDIQRYGWSHFSSNRSYIRMYDPRGIEFEITPENLIGILMETTCSKRGLDGKFVYAWHGTELVLLPCGSEEYQKAVTYTERQDQNIAAKDLREGCSYTTKKGEELVYVGRFKWYEYRNNYDRPDTRKGKRCYIFYKVVKPRYGNRFFTKDNVSFLASLNSIEPVQNYAEIIDKFNSCPASSETIKWETEPVNNFSLDHKTIEQYGKTEVLERRNYLELRGGLINFWRIDIANQYDREKGIYEFKGHYLVCEGNFNTKTLNYSSSSNSSLYGYRHYDPKVTPDSDIEETAKFFVNVFMVLESGKRVPFITANSLNKQPEENNGKDNGEDN